MERNKSYPLFFHLFTSLYYFKRKEYFPAYQRQKMGMRISLNILLRIAILSNWQTEVGIDQDYELILE
jgi:hypothetical protein